jgi:hypothetical protein
MTSVGLNNPNIPEKRDLNKKDTQSALGIESVRNIKDQVFSDGEGGTYQVKKLDDSIGENQANKRDEIYFQVGKETFVASGKNIDVDAFHSVMESSNPVTMNGRDITVKFVDDEAMELNSISAMKKFNIEEIRELSTDLGDAVGDDLQGYTEHNGLDEIFFRADGKDYVAYGKKIDTDAADDADNIAKGSSNPLTFNGKEATIITIDDEANTFREGWFNATHSDVGTAIIGGATAAGLGMGFPGGAITMAVFGAAGFAASTTLVGTVGAIHGAFNKPDYSSIDEVAKPKNELTKGIK